MEGSLQSDQYLHSKMKSSEFGIKLQSGWL